MLLGADACRCAVCLPASQRIWGRNYALRPAVSLHQPAASLHLPLPPSSCTLQGTGPDIEKVDDALAVATSFASLKL